MAAEAHQVNRHCSRSGFGILDLIACGISLTAINHDNGFGRLDSLRVSNWLQFTWLVATVTFYRDKYLLYSLQAFKWEQAWGRCKGNGKRGQNDEEEGRQASGKRYGE